MTREIAARIAVGPEVEFRPRAKLFRSLGRALSIDFVSAADAPCTENVLWLAGDVFSVPESLSDTPAEDAPARNSGQVKSAALVLVPTPVHGPRRVVCSFTDDALLDPVLRGQELLDQVSGLPDVPGVNQRHVFAVSEGKPIWVRQVYERNATSPVSLPPRVLDRVAFASGTTQLERPPVADFVDGCLFPWLPILHWLRERCGEAAWRPNGVRAAILFDDPNLHASTYGWMNFSKLADLMREERAHCSIATIPLDAWRADPRAARHFRGTDARLSLSIHGNDHVFCEMERAADDDGRRTMMIQALQRIEGLERRAAVSVDRIVIPPHSRFDGAMRKVMWDLPFQAICCGGRAARAVETPDPALAWLGPGEAALGNCPVLDRIPITDHRQMLVWRAFLGYPLIVYGHHGDLAAGDGLVSGACRWINALGDVRWLRLGQFARTNYLMRRSGERLEIRAFSHGIDVDVPEGVETVAFGVGFDAPLGGAAFAIDGEPMDPSARVSPGAGVKEGFRGITAEDPPGSMSVPVSDRRTLLLKPRSSTLRIEVRSPHSIDPMSVGRVPTSSWAVIRRVLTESRDRALPVVRRVRARKG